MKIVLREHVEHLGDRGDIVNVANGYARNFLLPKRLAYPATPGNLKTIEHQRRMWAVKEAKEIGEAQALADRLSALELTTVKKAGESGTLYGSVTRTELAEMLASHGFAVDRRRIQVDPIKSVGEHDVKIKVYRQISATVRLRVDPENPIVPSVPDTEPVPVSEFATDDDE